MSYNLDVLVSNIPANLEVGLDEKHYFQVGNTEAISASILKALSTSSITIDNSKLIQKKYNWDIIAKETIQVYKTLKS